MQLRGMVPGPHKIWLSNPKLSKTIVPTGAYYQKESTLTKVEIEIATNLVNARWLAAYANYEHEIIGQEQGHELAYSKLASQFTKHRRCPC
jgi:4-carboxymuconolactone decarboxylase